MLIELKVKNLGIIEDMHWQPGDGLNVITGETGAGKSLIIDAIEILLSGKADEQAIRYGMNEAQIEGVFNIPESPAYAAVRSLLARQELSEIEDSLVISVRLRRHSPAVIRINGHAVTKSLLHQIGRQLVDIHGQSEHLSLLDPESHLDVLDAYGHTLELRHQFGLKFAALRQIEQDIVGLNKSEHERVTRMEFLKFQIDEIDRAKLQEDEEAELIAERNILSSTEKLKELSYDTYRVLYEEEGHGGFPALDRLNEAAASLKKLAELDPALRPQLQVLEDAVYALTDVARDIHAYGQRLHFDPVRLEEIESRLALFRELRRKYGQTIPAVIAYGKKAAAELMLIGRSTEMLAQLNDTRAALKIELGNLACRLSRERAAAAVRLARDVKRELDDLNMTQVQFHVSLQQRPDQEGIPFSFPLYGQDSFSARPDNSQISLISYPQPDPSDTEVPPVIGVSSNTEVLYYAFADNGADIVTFVVSTNPGEPAQPLARIASTGELSRFTLALKGALSEADNIPVLIFDEIDIGIGGRSGAIIGKKLWSLGRTHQVVCVTHLPQIAAYGDIHFGVRKTVSGERTLTVMEKFTGDSRVCELADMLSGAPLNETARQNALSMVRDAAEWQSEQGQGG